MRQQHQTKQPNQPNQPLRLIILILLYFAAAVWMAVRLPAHAAPNELLNYEYITVMRQIRGLPNRGLVNSEVRYTEWHQPPVYYTFAALVGLAIPVQPSPVNPPPPPVVEPNPHYLSTPHGNRNPTVHTTPQSTPMLYTSRLAAALLGTMSLAALYRAGKQLYSPQIGLLMTSLLAFQPNFLHLSGAVNNDMPLVATSTLALAYAALLLHKLRQQGEGQRPSAVWFFSLGLVCALAILTKANGVFVLAYFTIILTLSLLTHSKHPPTPRQLSAVHRLLPTSVVPNTYWLLHNLLPALVALLLPWGAWLVLNTIRMRDTLGLSGSLPVGRVLALNPADFSHLWPYLPYIWRSFWLDWSAGDIGFGPAWVYLFWFMALCVMVLGWLWRGWAEEQRSRGAGERGLVSNEQLVAGGERWRERLFAWIGRPSVLALAGFLAISYLYFAVKALTVKEAGMLVAEGRWWLPAMAPLAWLAAVGFARWWPEKSQPRACLIAATLPLLFTYALLFTHLPWLYPQADRIATGCVGETAACLPPDAATVPRHYRYGDRLELLASQVQPSPPQSDSFELTLLWRSLDDLDHDYTITTQLLAAGQQDWEKLSEHNSYPGGGLNPTRGWRAGDVYRDQLTLVMDGELNGPTRATVAVWVVEDGRPLPVSIAGQVVDDPPFAGDVVLRPSSPLSPTAGGLRSPVRFDSLAQLIAAEARQQNDQIEVILWWEAQAETNTDYTVFVHLLDQNGQLVAQQDAPPNSNRSPTSIWQAGDVVRDSHTIPLAETAAGPYQIFIGLYDRFTGQRLTASQDGRPLPNNTVLLPVQEE